MAGLSAKQEKIGREQFQGKDNEDGLEISWEALNTDFQRVRNPTWDMGASSRTECLTWVSCEMITVKWSLFWDLPVPTPECGFRVSYWKAMSRNFSRHIPPQSNATEMQMKPLGTHPETKPSNPSQKLFLYLLLWFPFVPELKQLFFFFYLEPLYSATGDFPFVGQHPIPRTYPRDLKTEAIAFPLQLLFLCLRNLPHQQSC